MVWSVSLTLTVTNWRTVTALVGTIPVSNYYIKFFSKKKDKTHTREESGAHLRISFLTFIAELEKQIIIKKLLK